MYLASPEPLEGLRRHFRDLLMMKLPDQKQVYFRFYDPRVLRLFLPTCTAQEIGLIFGPVITISWKMRSRIYLPRFSNKGVGVGEEPCR